MHCKQAGTHINCTHSHTLILSSRQQGPVSDHGGPWICSVVRANDLRHMSSPCGFKTKHCQECSALAGQPAPCSAALCMRQAIQSSQSKTKPIIILSHRSLLFFPPTDCGGLRVCAPLPSPFWAAATDLPARPERGPRHPGDWVHSHYPLWEKLRGGPGKGEREREEEDGDDKPQLNKKKVCVECMLERMPHW